MSHQLSFLHEQGYQRLNTGMCFNSPFIITREMKRCDLGECIIGTFPPHFVAKIHRFATQRKNERLQREEEMERVAWLQERVKAHALAIEARSAGYESIKKYVTEVQGKNFDEEFDEDRLVVKVPGLNVYLEMYGCLEKMERASLSLTDASICLQKMAAFYRVNMGHLAVHDFGSDKFDPQPNEDWQEQYDASEFFEFDKFSGIGFSQVDLSRRPDRELIFKRCKEKYGKTYEKR